MVDVKSVKEIASSFSLLYVEDDKDIAQAFITYLSKIFNEVVYAENGEEGLELYKQGNYELVITDINMPKMNGLDMSAEIKNINSHQNIIVVSAHSEVEFFLNSIKLGIDGYIIKPINYVDMNNALFKIVTKIKKFKEYDINVKQQQELLSQVSKNNSQLRQYTEMLDKVAIVSKTDLKGHITYVNDVFCNVAGYTREELIGKNHNIIRHPDMPKVVFKELWETIKKGEAWSGSIKNKSKNGQPYFVFATIMPLYDASNENIIEYIGIRFLTTEEENEKREFQKQVIQNIKEFRKTNFDATKKIEILEKTVQDLSSEDIYKTKIMQDLKVKNKKYLSQIDFYEKEMNKKSTSMRNTLDNTNSNVKVITENYRKSLITMDAQLKEIEFLKEDDALRKKEIVSLQGKLNEQREVVKGLRDTIKNIESSDKDVEAKPKHFWDKL